MNNQKVRCRYNYRTKGRRKFNNRKTNKILCTKSPHIAQHVDLKISKSGMKKKKTFDLTFSSQIE